MKRDFLAAVTAFLIPLFGLTALAQADTAGVRDAGKMFSLDARTSA
jgi:hypothetical protein